MKFDWKKAIPSQEKSAALPVLFYCLPTHLIINTTLAGVADGPLRGKIHFILDSEGKNDGRSFLMGADHIGIYLIPRHQYNPCRGSSIGRACGSYDSKEINLKVVGSSPTFGYSYIKAHQSEQLFFCFLFVLLPPRRPHPSTGLYGGATGSRNTHFIQCKISASQLNEPFVRKESIPWRLVHSIQAANRHSDQ
jgi:hypothetical protein